MEPNIEKVKPVDTWYVIYESPHHELIAIGPLQTEREARLWAGGLLEACGDNVNYIGIVANLTATDKSIIRKEPNLNFEKNQ
jgi:hypothetical protein